MTFIDTIKSSIYDPFFYSQLSRTPFKQSLRYFLKLSLLLTCLATLFYGAFLLPPLINFLSEQNLSRLISKFPSDLTITLKNGVVSTNSIEPRFIDLPISLKTEGINHFIVIDTSTPVSLETFEEYKSFIWVTRNSLVIKDDDRITIDPLSDMPNIVINQNSLVSLTNSVKPYFKYLPFILLPLLSAFILIGYIFYLAYLLLLSILIIIIAKSIKKFSLSFKDAYKIGLHALTLGLLIDIFIIIIPGFAGGIPFLLTAITLVVVFFNIKPPLPLIVNNPEQKPPSI